ncbi:hypothetical protein EVAR_20616_1 [Eumeta japonica]|uniref:Uncharacterized protein n=1 Tax=Eumeta variegata TaxID=151549 RepID=A0A4C1URZ9_EUMVA|nr:hypothetical protein EVAR_20616_1 [Eumeta japonica]
MVGLKGHYSSRAVTAGTKKKHVLPQHVRVISGSSEVLQHAGVVTDETGKVAFPLCKAKYRARRARAPRAPSRAPAPRRAGRALCRGKKLHGGRRAAARRVHLLNYKARKLSGNSPDTSL